MWLGMVLCLWAITSTIGIHEDDMIRALVLLPSNPDFAVSSTLVRPVLEIATSVITPQILPDKNFVFNWLDDKCDPEEALKQAVKALCPANERIHVIFGPTCEYSVAQVGRLVKFWKTPLLTTGALTFDFKKPKIESTSSFHLVLRVGPLDFVTMSRALLSTAQGFDWNKLFLLYHKNGGFRQSGENTCKLMMETLVELMKKYQWIYGAYDLETRVFDSLQDVLAKEIGTDYGRRSVRHLTDVIGVFNLNLLRVKPEATNR